MADGFVHTVSKDGSWQNTIEGWDDDDLVATYATKEDAVEAGRTEARSRQSEHVIHYQDGGIAERNSYGNDPVDRPS